MRRGPPSAPAERRRHVGQDRFHDVRVIIDAQLVRDSSRSVAAAAIASSCLNCSINTSGSAA